MPLQKLHPQGQPPRNQLSSKRQHLQARRRTLHTISELSITEGTMPDFNTLVTALQKQPQDQICHSKAMTDVVKASNRRSLPEHSSGLRYSQVEATSKAPPTHITTTNQKRPNHGFRLRTLETEDEEWNLRRDKARAQRQGAAALGYRRQPLQQILQDGSYPKIPRKVVHATSRSSLRSYSSHHHLLANSRSMSNFSSSSSSNGTLDRRSSLGTIGSQFDAWSHELGVERAVTGIDPPFRATRNIAVRRVKSSSSPKSSSISTAPPPRPAALPPVMHRYHSMPPQRFGNDERVFPNVRMPMSSTTRTSTLPTTHIDHVKLSQQSRRQSVSGAAQQQHQIDVRKARSESLAALTAVYPELHSLHHTSPPYLAKPYHAAMSSRQNHPASMQHRPKSTTHHRPPAQHTRLPPSVPNRNAIPLQHSKSHAVEHRAIPQRESLAKWKADREEAKSSFDTMRRASMKERLRYVNELESERDKELMKKWKRGNEVEADER